MSKSSGPEWEWIAPGVRVYRGGDGVPGALFGIAATVALVWFLIQECLSGNVL